jgi:PAS domain S-box-containing protein
MIEPTLIAQSVARDKSKPRHLLGGDHSLPRLILRLEPLAHPQPTRDRNAQSDPVDVSAPAADPAAPTPEPESATGGASEPTEAARRVVDISAPERTGTSTPLARWSAAVASAHDACFVLDLNGVLISISVAAVDLLGCGDAPVIGRHILEVIKLVDLESGAPNPDYAPRITALVVLNGPGLARSLMRVRHDDGAVVTLDTSSAPIHDVDGHLIGSVNFLAPIPAR